MHEDDQVPDLPLTSSPPRVNPLDEAYWYEAYLKYFCFGDIFDAKMKKPVPMLWAAYLVEGDCQKSRADMLTLVNFSHHLVAGSSGKLKFDVDKGRNFSKVCCEENIKILGEHLHDVEEYALQGHLPRVAKEVESWKAEHEADEDAAQKAFYKDRKSLLHYAVMSRNPKLVSYLLSQGCTEIVNRNDFITGFSPLHLAFFVQSWETVWLLIKNGVNFHLQDNFGATAMDYAYLLEYAPSKWDTVLRTDISFFDSNTGTIDKWPVSQYEKVFQVRWGQYYKCTEDYIFELLFSGFSIGEKDMIFRKKYFPKMEKSSGDENLVLAKIDDKVGYGVYAGKDFEKEEFIVRYVGMFLKDESEENRVYCMESGVEGIILSAQTYRNLGGMVNHSTYPNAEARCVFDSGVEQAIIISLKPIKRGQQILIDYSKAYGEGSEVNFVEFGQSDEFPDRIPI